MVCKAFVLLLSNSYEKRTSWRIQDFLEGVRQLPKVLLFFNFFAENCMKMKEFGPPGFANGTTKRPYAPWQIKV